MEQEYDTVLYLCMFISINRICVCVDVRMCVRNVTYVKPQSALSAILLRKTGQAPHKGILSIVETATSCRFYIAISSTCTL